MPTTAWPAHRRAKAFTVLALVAASTLTSCTTSSTALSGREKAVRATDTAVPFKQCATACTGETDGAKYAIKLPAKWNGTLLLYSHGYRFAEPGPPDFGPVSTSAQVSSTDGDGSGSDALSQQLLSQGYALAGSSYKSNGWAVADGVAAGVALHQKFLQLVGKPERTYVWGDSLGGLITELIAEQNPSWVDGAAPMCGAVAGPNLNFDAALDVAFAVKALIDPNLKLTGYVSAADANANWARAAKLVIKAASDTAHGGTAKVLFIAALSDAPSKTKTYDGHDIASQVKGTVEALLTALAFGTAGRYELEQRVGGNPSDNSKADYPNRLSEAETGLITTVGGDVPALEKALGAQPRVTADPAARSAFEKLGDTTGDLHAPTLTLHTEADPLVLVANEAILAGRVRTHGDGGELVQLYVMPPATYAESTGAPYGAGHCNFTDQQRAALVRTLDSWVRSSVYPVPVGVAGEFGSGLDPAFTPPPWPSGGTA
jgi:pimeloyl-ACP methyl ester carboxylesterase